MPKFLLFLLSIFISLTINAQSTLIGDINGDNQLTVSDVSELVNKLTGKSDPTYIYSAEDFIKENNLTGTYKINGVLKIYKDGEEVQNLNGHEYIDLGLSVMWATCNVGATQPEDYGLYFAWGETKGYKPYASDKHLFDWSNLMYCAGTTEEGPFTKYVSSDKYGTVDNLTTLEPSDDAATVNWGGAWRMPTDSEQTELRTKCTWTWTTQNGVNGYLVTGTNGNSIFLPAAGDNTDSSLNGEGSCGSFWSSSLGTSSYSARNTGFYLSTIERSNITRKTGCSVRPVFP